MKRSGVFLLVFLLAAVTASAQIMVTMPPVKSGEFNQSPLERMQMQTFARMQQIQQINEGPYATITQPGAFMNKGFANVFLLRNSFGTNTFLTHRVRHDLFLVGELGYYFMNENDEYPAVFDYYTAGRQNMQTAMVMPLQVGLRKGWSAAKIKAVYPYIGTGTGVAFGYGYLQRNSVRDHDFGLAPTAYVESGIELYTFKRWLIDLNVRYRHMKFGHEIGDWRDFSGMSFAIGFGRAFGGGLHMLR